MQMLKRQRTHWQPWVIALLLLTSCCPERLSSRMEYISRKSLASYQVKTPDPNLNNPPVGQQLIISWCLPHSALHCPDLYLRTTIRFRNGIEQVQYNKICKSRGMYKVSLVNEAYFETCGIQTYKVEILGNGEVLYHWHHQLWAELITIEN